MQPYVYSPLWAELVKRTLRAQMVIHGVSYTELRKRLKHIGTEQTEANLRNKINKGTLGAQLYLQIMLVLGVDKLDFREIQSLLNELAQTESS